MKKYKLTPIEKAIITLAEYIEAIPGCEYTVKNDILNILGLEKNNL